MDASFSPNGYVDAVSELDWQMWMDYAGDQQRFPRDQRHACGNPDCAALTEAVFCSELCRQDIEGPEDHEIEPDEDTMPSVSAVVAPLPEARSSVNVRLTIHGHECQVTLRDHDEATLLQRLEELLQRYPVAQASATPTQAPEKGWCPIHQVAMKLNEKEGRTWHSHKTVNGWCKGVKRG